MNPAQIAAAIKAASVNHPLAAPITPKDLLAEAEVLLGKLGASLPTIIAVLQEIVALGG
jgi:hypothetical protein